MAGATPPRPPIDINASREFVFVSHLGEVRPSGLLPIAGENIRERSLVVDIYRDAEPFTSLRDLIKLRRRFGTVVRRRM